MPPVAVATMAVATTPSGLGCRPAPVSSLELAEGDTRQTPAVAVLASAIIPGAGQLMLRQWRFVPYVALESYAWSSYARNAKSARRNRDAYRALASAVARAPFSETRPTGDFEYYERMEDFIASGVLDKIPGGVLEPEDDTTTFNGRMWLLARRTFWKDPASSPERNSPEWQRAESFYLRRAIRPEFRWSWAGAPAAQRHFRQLIRESNDGYRDALGALGVVLGNHMLSTVDAYVTVRLRRSRRASGEEYGISVVVPLSTLR